MRLPVHIWLREVNASPAELAGYFTELARHLDASPRRMRLVIESTVPASLDFDPSDGNPAVTVCGETVKFNLRHRWIPEHPVPLELGPAHGRRCRRTALLVDPVDGNRFRVRDRRDVRAPAWAYSAVAALGVAAAVTLHPLIFAALALAISILLVQLALSLWYNFRHHE